jgi:hypothetical protein
MLVSVEQLPHLVQKGLIHIVRLSVQNLLVLPVLVELPLHKLSSPVGKMKLSVLP